MLETLLTFGCGLASMEAVYTKSKDARIANLERLLRVVSGPSPSYQLKVRYRAQTGRSATTFQKSKSERLLSPKAVVQIARKTKLRTSANGQKRPVHRFVRRLKRKHSR